MTDAVLDLLVSILNLEVERQGLNVDEDGFGYNPKTLELDSVNDDSLIEALDLLWNTMTSKTNKNNNYDKRGTGNC